MKHAALLLILLTHLNAPALVMRGTISSSLGGTGVAGIDAAEGAFLNPAAVTLYPNLGIEGTFRDGAPVEGQHRHALLVGAADNSQESLFSGALHYARTRDLGRVDGVAEGELYHGAFGYRFTRLVALGASVYRLTYHAPLAPARNTTQWNYDLGGLLMFAPGFGFGYALRGLAGAGADVPRPLREVLEQNAGIYASLGELTRVRADLGRRERDNPEQKLSFAAGVELRMRSFFLLRLGFRHDEAGEGRLVSAGLSLDGPRLKLDYALAKDVVGSSGALHSVDLRMPF